MRRSLPLAALALAALAGALPFAAAGALAVRAARTASHPEIAPLLERYLAWAVGASVAGSLLAAALLARALRRPIGAFAERAMEIAQGKFGVQVDAARQGDLQKLAEVFNYMSQQLLAYDGENRRLYESLEEGCLQTMLALATVIDSKDSYTLGHSQRVGVWAAEIGRELHLTELEIKHLLYGGILHDIGKIGIVDPVLSKSSSLSPDEMEAMRSHPAIGAAIIGGIKFLKPVLPAVRHHHERWDGSGYPDHLQGESIPRMARIVGAADVWDACTSNRPYQRAMPAEQALSVLGRLRGTQLDPAVVDAIERLVRKKQATGELVSAGDDELRHLAAGMKLGG